MWYSSSSAGWNCEEFHEDTIFHTSFSVIDYWYKELFYIFDCGIASEK